MNFTDLSSTFLAACGGDTVKIFDISKQPNDPCVLSYLPSPGSQVNSVKWNHTNLVVASAGDDKKISLWRKNGQSVGTVPLSESDADNIDESIFAISFSNKGSRYLCSGGSGQVVRIWDLQRKRCIKWLKGHSETITGVMYNCKDEHLASISLKGDLILHNLASGARAADLKDPNEQVLRVLDYSRTRRHLLVTAGDDGSVHLWDTTARNPKISWTKQHSAPTTGVSFCPSNDKMIASVGLDKKLHIFDSGARRPAFSVSYETPFSSLAFRDDGWILAAGTNTGRVVFYDVRGKPQPTTVLRAYNSSEAVTSLGWQRSKPITVNESTCTAEIALLGGAGEDSILMPDQLPSVMSSGLSSATSRPSSRGAGRTASTTDASLLSSSSGLISTTSQTFMAEETPQRNHLWTGGALARLQAPRTSYNFNDEMEVFSPLVDVQPITPSLGHWWDDQKEAKKDNVHDNKNPTLLPSSSRRFPLNEDASADLHPISEWKSYSTSRQEDTPSTSQLNSTPTASIRSDQSFSPTPPEAWGANPVSDKLNHLGQPHLNPSRFMPSSSLTSLGLMSGSLFAGLQDSSTSLIHSNISSLTTSSLNPTTQHGRDNSHREIPSGLPEPSISTSLDTKSMAGSANLEFQMPVHLTLPRRFSTYAERLSTASSFSEGTGLGTASPKLKKTGMETREELINSILSRSDSSAANGTGIYTSVNGATTHPPRSVAQTDQQQGTSAFALQLVQRTVEETLTSVQNSIHEDLRSLHIELIRQFHVQEIEISSGMKSVLEKVDELTKEVQSLRKENQQLRQLL